jgi:hypothetical protein
MESMFSNRRHEDDIAMTAAADRLVPNMHARLAISATMACTICISGFVG